jgi:hypothetical protein
MLSVIVSALLSILTPAPVWAGAGSLGDLVVISSGANTAGITADGELKVSASIVSPAIQNVNIVSTFSRTNPGYVYLTDGVSTASVSGGVLQVSFTSNPNRKYYAVAPTKINAAVAASDNPMLMLVNLATSTISANIIARTMGCDVSNVIVNYRTFINPVVTSSGTYIKPVRVYQTAGIPESQIQAYTLPTVSSPGSAIDNIAQGQNTAAAHREDNQTVSIAPGNRLLITADPSSNNRAQYISVRWLEE